MLDSERRCGNCPSCGVAIVVDENGTAVFSERKLPPAPSNLNVPSKPTQNSTTSSNFGAQAAPEQLQIVDSPKHRKLGKSGFIIALVGVSMYVLCGAISYFMYGYIIMAYYVHMPLRSVALIMHCVVLTLVVLGIAAIILCAISVKKKQRGRDLAVAGLSVSCVYVGFHLLSAAAVLTRSLVPLLYR